MASGNFTAKNKIRPGAYLNFVSGKKQSGINISGTIAMPMVLDWGNSNTLVEVTSQTNTLPLLGRNYGEKQLTALQEALKTASKVLLFNVAGTDSVKASLVLSTGLGIEAIKAGALGNEINVSVEDETSGSYTILTYFRNLLVDKQTIMTVNEFVENNYITLLEGTGELVATTPTALTGGATGETTNSNYLEFFKTLETQDFYAYCLDNDTEELKELAVSYCKKWRDQEGKKVVFVTADYEANYEGVINIGNGVVLANGAKLTANECAPYIAGAMANAGIAHSLTYHVYEGAVDANPRLAPSDIEEKLVKGVMIFSYVHNTVVVEQDINSLTTFTDIKNRDFRKNKIIRVIDVLNNELISIYSKRFIGTVSNNEDGRELLKKDILALLEEFKQNAVLNDYSSEDVEVLLGSDKDIVVVNMAISIADAMEKMYVTITLD